jgi:hypothetical protein
LNILDVSSSYEFIFTPFGEGMAYISQLELFLHFLKKIFPAPPLPSQISSIISYPALH